jgi:hypothetical protein
VENEPDLVVHFVDLTFLVLRFPKNFVLIRVAAHPVSKRILKRFKSELFWLPLRACIHPSVMVDK